jgi:hypothetical protein
MAGVIRERTGMEMSQRRQLDSSGLMRALFDARDNHALGAADFQKVCSLVFWVFD